MSTYVPIQAITLTANTATVSFTGIPQTYNDLILVIEGTLTASGNKRIYFNGLNTNQSSTVLYGNGTSPASARYTGNGTCYLDVVNSGTNRFTNTIQIMNYASQTTNKAYLSSHNSAAVATENIAGLWSSTSAITSFDLVVATGASAVYANGTTFTLYGMGTGSPKALGGTTVTTDGTYWYHTFRSSGQFTPTQALTADYLVVAGGGGGGFERGGGGGAGGLRSTVTATGGGGSLETPLNLLSGTNYTVTVGAGGPGLTSYTNASPGANSIFASITATGGGGGGGNATTALNGGSGGGANYNAATTFGTGTANQGFNGGQAQYANGSGGGGGAGSVGVNATASGGGNGGAGIAVSITGSSVTYAGGGGGGADTGKTAGIGGSGGGGNGTNNNATAGSGTANLGSGGGGGGFGGGGGSGGSGGSGIVIVRYSV